jgi:RNA polymerase sigma-70 factor (ECF subfamily)
MTADRESSEWLRTLSAGGAEQDAAEARLHRLLIRVSASELHRRRTQLDVTGPELDDMAHQAAADALVSITARLGQFRGESRFTTWACKFAIFEVSAKVGRHFWRRPQLPYDREDWEALPDRFGFDVAEEAEARELVAALRAAVEEELSERQRTAFVAIVLNGVPADALAVQLGSNRNAIYKTLFDARRKLRAALAESGHLDPQLARRP